MPDTHKKLVQIDLVAHLSCFLV